MRLKHLLIMQVLVAILAFNLEWQPNPKGLFFGRKAGWSVGVYVLPKDAYLHPSAYYFSNGYCVAGVYDNCRPVYLLQLYPTFAFYKGIP